MIVRSRKLMAEINVVPYIDVMLVLLVIFMVTVPLIQQGVEVNLPEAPAKTIDSGEIPDPLIVTVDEKGNLFVNKGEPINYKPSPALLIQQIKKWLPASGNEIYIRGDRLVDYGSVVSVLVILQNAGIENVGLITQPEDG